MSDVRETASTRKKLRKQQDKLVIKVLYENENNIGLNLIEGFSSFSDKSKIACKKSNVNADENKKGS